MERSLVFSCLLAKPGFGRLSARDAEQVTTKATEAWQASDATDMFAFVQQWLEEHPLPPAEEETS